MEQKEFKQLVYNQFSRISKALSSPRRFELLDLLSQGSKTVDNLSKETNMSMANTSKHLQALLAAKLVKFTKKKNYIYYSLADSAVNEVVQSIKSAAESRFTELTDWKNEYIQRNKVINTMSLETVIKERQKNTAILIDVRSDEEYHKDHIYGALSMPVQTIQDKEKLLPKNKKIIAYCRGPYCVYATEAAETLLSLGYEAYRMDEGINEWKRYFAALPPCKGQQTE